MYLGFSRMLGGVWLGCSWRRDEGHLGAGLLLFVGGNIWPGWASQLCD